MQQSNSNWPLPGPTLYIQPPLTLFLNTTPPILQLSSPGVLAECTASKHSQPAPLDKEKKEKASKEEEKRGGCFLFRSSSETGQKFMCITINQNISSYNGQKVFIMARKCLQYSFRTSILLNAFNGRNLLWSRGFIYIEPTLSSLSSLLPAWSSSSWPPSKHQSSLIRCNCISQQASREGIQSCTFATNFAPT